MLCAHPLPLVALVPDVWALLFGMFDVVPSRSLRQGRAGLTGREDARRHLASASLGATWVLQPQDFARHFGVRFALRSSPLVCAVVPVTVPLTLAAGRDALDRPANVLLIAIGNRRRTASRIFAATNNAAAHGPSRVGAVSGVHVTAEASASCWARPWARRC